MLKLITLSQKIVFLYHMVNSIGKYTRQVTKNDKCFVHVMLVLLQKIQKQKNHHHAAYNKIEKQKQKKQQPFIRI